MTEKFENAEAKADAARHDCGDGPGFNCKALGCGCWVCTNCGELFAGKGCVMPRKGATTK